VADLGWGISVLVDSQPLGCLFAKLSTVRTQLGPGRIVIAVYGIFAISATARASYQLATKFSEAPLAYSLSALAAVVYLIATVLLAKDNWRPFAKYAIWFELLGVLFVGTLSVVNPELFNHPSVWSGFGVGYGFVPLFLPVIGIFWLRKVNA